MGPPKLADTLQIPLEEAEQLFREYALAFPKLNKWLENQAKLGKKQGFIRLPAPHNGIRWFTNMKLAYKLRQEDDVNWREVFKIEGKTERDSMNTPIQGGGAAICKEALVVTRELLKKYDGLMLIQVHDEIDFEIREDQAEAFTKEACALMEQVGNKYVKHVKMAVEATITDFWTK